MTKSPSPVTQEPRNAIRDRVVELRRVRAGDLIANPRNWRRHPERQRAAMRGILAEVGYAGALLARETPSGLMLIDGHLRAETTPDQAVPVLVLDVTEEEANKLLATVDPIAALAEGDDAALRQLLEHVHGESAEVRGLLGDLARAAGGTPATRSDPDAVPDPPLVALSRLGDTWILGDHRLRCGDSTNAADVAQLMDGASAALLWTDPPYGVRYVGKTKNALRIANDGPESLSALLAATWAAVTPVLEPGAPFYVARPAGALALVFGRSIDDAGWKLHEELQWVKDTMVLGHSDYHLRHETILYGWVPGPGRSGRGKHEGSRWYGGNAETSVFEIPRPKASPEHPTGKPVALVARHLANSSRAGEIVLEPFSGSGTTLIACEQLGRRGYAMELEPRYVDVGVRRWESVTGNTATLAATGQTFADVAEERGR